MTEIEANDLWQRAIQAYKSAKILVTNDYDGSASRSYYAAFNAVSALLALDDLVFKKHSAVESSVHRDFVKSGKWDKKIGASYTFLRALRDKGDYGGGMHVSSQEALEAIAAVELILSAVSKSKPELFAFMSVP
jgi:uncharacterized protein (UPF0332 family)